MTGLLNRTLDKKDPLLLQFEGDDVLARIQKTGDLLADVLTLQQKLSALKA